MLVTWLIARPIGYPPVSGRFDQAEHDQRLHQADRLYEGKRDAYRATLRYALAQARFVRVYKPFLDEGVEIPERPSRSNSRQP